MDKKKPDFEKVLGKYLAYYFLLIRPKNGSQIGFADTSLRKQPTFGHATTGFPANWRLRNERRNSILMTRHYPDPGIRSAPDCLNHRYRCINIGYQETYPLHPTPSYLPFSHCPRLAAPFPFFFSLLPTIEAVHN